MKSKILSSVRYKQQRPAGTGPAGRFLVSIGETYSALIASTSIASFTSGEKFGKP
jgi:hypothetical protein